MKPIATALAELKQPFPKVSWKVQNTKKDESAALVVAYVDARDVSERLNSVCPGQWSNKHSELILDGKLEGVTCTITLRDDETSVHVEDIGIGDPILVDMKPYERDVTIKTYWSDAFKRAGVKLGIASSLYDLPKIWLNENELYKPGDKIKGINKEGDKNLAARYERWVESAAVINKFGPVR